MNVRKVLLMAIVVLGLVGLTQAEENKLGVSLDVTYMSKLMDKGGEYYSENGGLLKTLDLDLWGTGFGIAVEHRESIGSGFVDKERFAYKVYYSNNLFEGEKYVTKYKAYWKLNHHPGKSRRVGNAQELNLSLSWPKILPGGLVPSYAFYSDYPAGSGYANRDSSYYYHLFGLGYALKVDGLPNPLNLSAKTAYRDGGSGNKDHDWSHATLGMSTQFKITKDISFVPGIYHQISMDDSICDHNVTYCKLSMKFKF